MKAPLRKWLRIFRAYWWEREVKLWHNEKLLCQDDSTYLLETPDGRLIELEDETARLPLSWWNPYDMRGRPMPKLVMHSCPYYKRQLKAGWDGDPKCVWVGKYNGGMVRLKSRGKAVKWLREA